MRRYDYTITLIREKRHYLLFENWMLLICQKLNPYLPRWRMLCCKFGWNWLTGSINFFNAILLFRYSLLLVKGEVLQLKKKSHSHCDALFQVWSKLTKWFLSRRVLNFVNAFSLFYSPWKTHGSFSNQTFHHRMPFAKFGLNCFSGSRFFQFVNMFTLFRYYIALETFVYIFWQFVIISPCKRTWPFIWANLKPLNQIPYKLKF